VFGLDNRPVVKRRAIMHRESPSSSADGAQGFTPDQLAQIYNAPPGVDGTGQAIGIIELGGGYRPEDLAVYFKGLGIPAPTSGVTIAGYGISFTVMRDAFAGTCRSCGGVCEMTYDVD
jgi:subtilase family serine protease